MLAGGEFRPRMQARTQALRLLAPLQCRRFSGAIADVWHVEAGAGGGGFYVAPDPRIVIFLDDEPVRMALNTDRDSLPDQAAVRAFYIPAGVPLWSAIHAPRHMRHLDIHLEAPALAQRLAAIGRAGAAQIMRPRLIVAEGDQQLLALARALAAKVAEPESQDAALDQCCSAILAELFRERDLVSATSPKPGAAGLSDGQMHALTLYLNENLSRHVTVGELAAVLGLSESWFAHLFKQSRKETPQHWQGRLRLEAACAMMRDPKRSLTEIAYSAGFADQAHLSRQFRSFYGTAPSQWRAQDRLGA